MKSAVVLVHGIWMTPLEMGCLARRLRHCGFSVYRFGYASVRQSPQQNARQLQGFLAGLKEDVVHLVGHSLGGIVLLHLFDQFPVQRPGKVVFLGTPLRGSALAKRIAASRLLRPLLGRAAERGVLGDVPAWQGERETMMIAATRRMGLGTLLMPFALPSPSDGTVSVAETQATWLSHHRLLATTHLGLVFSKQAARMICRFCTDSQ